MKISKKILQRTTLVLSILALLFTVAQPVVYADDGTGMSAEQRKLMRSGVYYFDIKTATSACGASDSETQTSGVTLTGSDAQQQAFNYFKDAEGLSDVQSAGIVGNLMQESGVNPKSNQGGGGVGKGIAQWSPDRWSQLVKSAGSDEKALTLGAQLQFMSKELHGQAPATGDYSAVLAKLKQQTDTLSAAGFFMGTIIAESAPELWKPDQAAIEFVKKYGAVGGFENPGRPELGNRITNADQVLKLYGTGDTGDSVSGLDAACGSTGAVDCNSSGDAATSNLSPVRQGVVCLAKAELELWKSGKLKPGDDFYKYVPKEWQKSTTPWCAGFVSWIYNAAGHKVNSAGVTMSSQEFLTLDTFDHHSPGSYVPVPGDVVVYTYTASSGHVNIVTSVNESAKTMTVIGGNQSGDVAGSGADSSVTEYTLNGFSGHEISGFASPKGD